MCPQCPVVNDFMITVTLPAAMLRSDKKREPRIKPCRTSFHGCVKEDPLTKEIEKHHKR